MIPFGKSIQGVLDALKLRDGDNNEQMAAFFTTEISQALISFKFDYPTITPMIKRLKEIDFSDHTHVYQAVFDELCILMGRGIPPIKPIEVEGETNVVVIDGFLGIGNGLTTTCLKYASYYQDKDQRYKPAIVFAGEKIDSLATRMLKKGAKQKKITCIFVRETSIILSKVQNLKHNNHKLIIVGVNNMRERKQIDEIFVGVNSMTALKKKNSMTEEKQIDENLKPIVMLAVKSSTDVVTCLAYASFAPDPHDGVIVMDMNTYAQAIHVINGFAMKKWPIAFIGIGKENKDFEIFDADSFVSHHLGIQVPSKEKEDIEDIAQETLMDKLKMSSEREKEPNPNSATRIPSPTSNSSSLQQVANIDVPSTSDQQISLQNEDVKHHDKEEVIGHALIIYKCKGDWGYGRYTEDSELGSRDVDGLWVCRPPSADQEIAENTRRFSRRISHKNFLTLRFDHPYEDSHRRVCERIDNTLVNYIEGKKVNGDELIMEYTLKAEKCVPRKSCYVPPEYRVMLKDMTDFMSYVGASGQSVAYIELDNLAVRDGVVKFHDIDFQKFRSPPPSPSNKLFVTVHRTNALSLFNAIKALFDHFGFKETDYPYDLKDFLRRLKNYNSDNFLPNHLALMSPSERIGFISRIWNERLKLGRDQLNPFKYSTDKITRKLHGCDWTLHFHPDEKSDQLGPVNDCFNHKGSYRNTGESFLNFCRVLCQHLNKNIHTHGFDSSALDVDLTLMEVFAKELILVQESLHEQGCLKMFLT